MESLRAFIVLGSPGDERLKAFEMERWNVWKIYFTASTRILSFPQNPAQAITRESLSWAGRNEQVLTSSTEEVQYIPETAVWTGTMQHTAGSTLYKFISAFVFTEETKELTFFLFSPWLEWFYWLWIDNKASLNVRCFHPVVKWINNGLGIMLWRMCLSVLDERSRQLPKEYGRICRISVNEMKEKICTHLPHALISVWFEVFVTDVL